MNQERLFKVVKGWQSSEKGNRIGEAHNQFVFKVGNDATKPEIKAAIEQYFDVKVKSVQTLQVKGKKKRFGRSIGQQKNWKKAFVSLQDGYDIEFTGAE